MRGRGFLSVLLRLGNGTDRIDAAPWLAIVSWQPTAWLEQLGGGDAAAAGRVTVSARQPREDLSSTAQAGDRQECAPGSRPMTLTAAWSGRGPLDEPGAAHPGPVLVEGVQVDGQRQAVGEQERAAAG